MVAQHAPLAGLVTTIPRGSRKSHGWRNPKAVCPKCVVSRSINTGQGRGWKEEWKKLCGEEKRERERGRWKGCNEGRQVAFRFLGSSWEKRSELFGVGGGGGGSFPRPAAGPDPWSLKRGIGDRFCKATSCLRISGNEVQFVLLPCWE